jgi:hypothetical protein
MRTTRVQRPKINDPENIELHIEASVQETKKEDHTGDRFDARTYCERTGLVARTYNQFFRLEELCRTTPFVPGHGERLESIKVLRDNLQRERLVTPKKLVEYRQKIGLMEKQFKQIQKGVFLETFKTLSKDIKANLLGLCVLKTLMDGDLDAAFVQMKSPNNALLCEQDILLRFDPPMLKTLVGVGVCKSMSVDERKQIESSFAQRRRKIEKAEITQGHTNLTIKSFLDALYELEVDEGKINSQVLQNGAYYGLESAYWPILDRLCRFLEEHGTWTFSRSRMNSKIIDSLYPIQLAQLCALKVIESIDSKGIKALMAEGLCQNTDFVKSGILHYRIHNDGLCVLREFLKDEQIDVAENEASRKPGYMELDVELY